MSYRLSKEEFGLVIEEALRELPPEFARVMETVRVEVRDRPTRKMLMDARVGPGHTLLGLYHGRPATKRSVEDSGAMPDVIYLFQNELEETVNDAEQLRREIRRTVLHEVGHHFGLREGELRRLGYG
jgi:predicted Zn-dependent protease with MMP-like domain